MPNKEKQCGITLISLVITVIILLILAGVALSLITGESNLISKVDYAANSYKLESENEENQLNNYLDYSNKYDEDYIEPFEYNVIFNENGGTGTMENQQMVYGTSANLTANSFTRTGRVFTGWNTEENGSGTWYKDGQSVKNLTRTEGTDVTLYAQWGISVKYAVQIYGINQDVDENDELLGLTFGPATGANYNNAYVTHEYEKITNTEDSNYGKFNVKIVTHTVASNGTETTAKKYLYKDGGTTENVTRTLAEKNKYDVNIHEMTWEEIAAQTKQDPTVFLDCMLCGDTKKVEMKLNSIITGGSGSNQYGDGAGVLLGNNYYTKWNPSQSQNSYVGTGVTLDSNEINNGSNARNAGGYSSSHIRATLIGENEKTNRSYAGDINLTEDTCLYSCIESDLRAVITPKKVKYVTGTSSSRYSLNDDIADSIWLFSEREMYGTGQNSGKTAEGLGASGDGYDKFGNPESNYYMSSYDSSGNNNRRRYHISGYDTVGWLRSPYLNLTYYVKTHSSGSVNGNFYSSDGERFGLWFLYSVKI